MSLKIDIDGHSLPLSISHNKRAKRLILRMDPKTGGVKITLPPYADPDDALEMAKRHKVWIANHLNQLGVPPALCPGAQVPLRGQDLPLHHDPDRRRPFEIEDNRIVIGGHLDFFARRLKDGFKKEARSEISALSTPMADDIGKRIKKIVLRDTVSRWGSCTAQGVLNFNWRLIMAPPHILRYVVAHEVAHLKEMNHSADFWSVVQHLHPQYKRDRHWLKKNGARLQSLPF